MKAVELIGMLLSKQSINWEFSRKQFLHVLKYLFSLVRMTGHQHDTSKIGSLTKWVTRLC